MPVESYIGCLDCLQHTDYDCCHWCDNIHSDDIRTEGVIQMERLEEGFVKVYYSKTNSWVLGRLDNARWIDWRFKRPLRIA